MDEITLKQLRYYNSANLDGFCSCYHKDVVVLNSDGAVKVKGMKEFKELYSKLFSEFNDVKAKVTERIVVLPHVAEKEFWSRVKKDSNEELSGEAIVIYTLKEGLIKTVQFFMN
ncbi:MAG: nuclear transport factor 2 family protein [Nanoarchaeota archaeon]